MNEMTGKTPIELVKAQLETWAKSDAALAAVYTPDKLKDCWEYIEAQARKMAEDRRAAVSYETVYRWARDFYVDGKADDAAPKRKGKVYEVEATAEPHPADPTVEEAPKADDSQLDLFAEVQA